MSIVEQQVTRLFLHEHKEPAGQEFGPGPEQDRTLFSKAFTH
jgi:hypothetical protein